jgi:hypothetical protein
MFHYLSYLILSKGYFIGRKTSFDGFATLPFTVT